MSATFNPALTTALDRTRFHLGDVGTTEGQFAFLVTDELVGGVLGLRGTTAAETTVENTAELLSAADLADQLGIMFARQADTSNLSLSISASQRSEQFKDCARRLRARAGQMVGEDGAIQIAAEMFAGGLTISGKEALDSDTDATQPQFHIGQDDHPNSGSGTDPDDGLH